MNAVIPLPGISLEFLQSLQPHHLSPEEQQVVVALAIEILEQLHQPGELPNIYTVIIKWFNFDGVSLEYICCIYKTGQKEGKESSARLLNTTDNF